MYLYVTGVQGCHKHKHNHRSGTDTDADTDADADATLQSGKPVDDKESPPFASPKNVDLYVEKFLKKEGAKKLGKDEFSSEDGVANDL